MDELYTFLLAYRAIIGAAVLTAILAICIVNWWDEVKLFFKSATYGLPIIGKTRRLAKDTTPDQDGWFTAERILCDDFSGDIRRIAEDPEMYDKSKSYLQKVDELGRNELGLFMRLLLLTLMAIEALGLGYILASYMIANASAADNLLYGFGFAVAVSILLVLLTHFTGSELHKRGLIKKIRTLSEHDKDPDARPLTKTSNHVSLDNDADDDEADYHQMKNRLQTNANVTPGTPWVTIITTLLIIVIAIVATVVRYQTYQQEKIAETTGLTVTESMPTFSLDSLMGDSESSLPEVLQQPQNEADSKAVDERTQARDTGSITTYIFLAIVFVVIQCLGITIGYKTGFAGKESKAARRTLGNFKSRYEYETWYERKRDAIARIAQKHLSHLQKLLASQVSKTSVDQRHREMIQTASSRTFIERFETTEAARQKAKTAKKIQPVMSESTQKQVSKSDTEPKTEATDDNTPAASKRETQEERIQRLKEQAAKTVEAEEAAKATVELANQETDEELLARFEAEERERRKS